MKERPVASITKVLPGELKRGLTHDLLIMGDHTRFQDGSVADLGEGITVHHTWKVTPFCVGVHLTIADDAAAGPRDVTVTKGSQTVTLPDGLTVLE